MDAYLEAVEQLMEAARAVIDGAEARPSRVSRVPALLLTTLAQALAPLEEAEQIYKTVVRDERGVIDALAVADGAQPPPGVCLGCGRVLDR